MEQTKFTIGQAAKETGKAKSTISRDIKDGTISAKKNEDGSYSIDASELFRVYERVSEETRSATGASNDPQPLESPVGTGGLNVQLEALREQLRAFVSERDRERAQLVDQIEDLRGRLTAEGEERRRLTAVLTDQRTSLEKQAQERSAAEAIAAAVAAAKETVMAAQEPPQAGFLSRLFGRDGRKRSAA